MKAPLAGPGVYPTPLGTKGLSAVDVRDIGKAAAIALTEDGHDGKTYDLVGPDELTGPGVAALWGELLHKNVHYVGEVNQWEQQARQFVPIWQAFGLRTMFEAYEERGFAAKTGNVEKLTALLGRPPRRYREFAEEAVRSWKQS